MITDIQETELEEEPEEEIEVGKGSSGFMEQMLDTWLAFFSQDNGNGNDDDKDSRRLEASQKWLLEAQDT